MPEARYRHSINLKCWVRSSVPYIHPAYNEQLRALPDAIKAEVQRVWSRCRAVATRNPGAFG
jgi:hypothetical protein